MPAMHACKTTPCRKHFIMTDAVPCGAAEGPRQPTFRRASNTLADKLVFGYRRNAWSLKALKKNLKKEQERVFILALKRFQQHYEAIRHEEINRTS